MQMRPAIRFGAVALGAPLRRLRWSPCVLQGRTVTKAQNDSYIYVIRFGRQLSLALLVQCLCCSICKCASVCLVFVCRENYTPRGAEWKVRLRVKLLLSLLVARVQALNILD